MNRPALGSAWVAVALFLSCAQACNRPPASAPRSSLQNSQPGESSGPRTAAHHDLALGEAGYFERPGLNVMAFSDFYPEGHQGGVTIIQNGVRTAANGDVRLEPTPGQWQPVPRLLERKVDEESSVIVATLAFPDPEKHQKGFNPIEYPDLDLTYHVRVEPEGENFRVIVDLDEPLPEEWVGRIGFNLELFPGEYFGKSFHVGDETGTFPRQMGGPMLRDAQGRLHSEPLGRGSKLSVAPETPSIHMQIESLSEGQLTLWDGRAEHNNGWFVVRGELSADTTDSALVWRVSPTALPGFVDEPVLHLSQLGYHPEQRKVLAVELDPNDDRKREVVLLRVLPDGTRAEVARARPDSWGRFLRYRYETFDFGRVREEGVYVFTYGEASSNPFRISRDIFDRYVWQPTLEYFLPVQMCHMRVNDRYRVWHDHCHEDDALMAPTSLNHFDGYVQGPSTLTQFAPGEAVPNLAQGGWHDAGDYDLRVESQIRTVRVLSQIHEEFGVDYDATTVDQKARIVELHRPDGKPDVLQQIEHGLLSVVAGYDSLGRLYRGIIAPTNRQYVLLGDASAQTDGHIQERVDGKGELDDRWVFTEDNPARELEVAAGLLAASRALAESNAPLAERCLDIAKSLLKNTEDAEDEAARAMRVQALAELALTTQAESDIRALERRLPDVLLFAEKSGWALGRVLPLVKSATFKRRLFERMAELAEEIRVQAGKTPFGVPYTPKIWGAGWGIQEFGVRQYFLAHGWPDLFSIQHMLSALDFMLGNHPGKNTASFVSGVGHESLTVAYGVNRADWSYIPGGVGSGTALIRPDFPELKTWPFFWQQSEYVIGGGGSNFLFLALAAERQLSGEGRDR